MRRLVLAALLAVTAAPALAQVPPPEVRQDERDHRGDTRDARPDNRGDNRDARPDGRDFRQENGGIRQDEHRSDRDGQQGGYDHRDGRDMRQDDHRGYQDQRGDQGGRDFHDGRDYRHDDRRDYGNRGDIRQDYRQAFRDDRRGYGESDSYARFHGNRYFYPRGYGYRYYSVGTFLPRVFFDQRYYIGNPYAYRLPLAYAGTRWIRVGPDALLIRVYDGRVVRVIQGLFY